MKSGTVPVEEMMTNGQALDIASALVQAAPRLIGRSRADQLIKDKSVWQGLVRDLLAGTVTEPAQIDIGRELESWERDYAEVYGRRLNLSKVVVPELPAGKFRRPKLLVVDPSLKLNQIFEASEEAFPSWRYTDDLDGAVAKEQPRPQELYALWTEGSVEPSEEHSNISPDQIDKRKLVYLVIRERMLLERRHYTETNGGHLDLVNVTIASSRYSGGYAFCADWSGGQFRVDWWDRDGASSHGRIREAVLPS